VENGDQLEPELRLRLRQVEGVVERAGSRCCDVGYWEYKGMRGGHVCCEKRKAQSVDRRGDDGKGEEEVLDRRH